MKRYFFHFTSLMLLLMAVSCTQSWDGEQTPDNTNIESRMILRIKTPGNFSSGASSRGLTLTQESDINNIWVLVFNSGGTLVDIRQGENLSSTPPANEPNIRSFSAKLYPSENASDRYTLVVLANGDGILTNTIGTDIDKVTGERDYLSVVSRLREGVGAKMYLSGGSIPMWGETAPIVVEKNGGTIDLKLMRAIARVDVGVGTRVVSSGGGYSWSGKNDKGDPIPFQMTDVYIISPNNAYSAVPVPANLDADKRVTAPTVPAGTASFTLADSKDKFHFTGTEIIPSGSADDGKTWGSYTTQQIYLPEADVKLAEYARSGDANHEKRMAIVVGGVYGNTGKTTYYRLDFASGGNIMDVLRNHLYQFNIKKVSGAGYDDVETAYRSMATNMAVEILEWDDAEMNDIVFDGQYYLSINSRKVEFSPMGDEVFTVRLKTNVPDFEMRTMSTGTEEVGLKAMRKPTYRQEDMGYDYALANTSGDEYELTIKAGKHNVSNTIPNRLEKWSIRAGRLNMSFEVDQQYTVLYVSYVNGASATLMPEGTGGTIKLPIQIMALVPVQITTEGDDGGSWIDLGDVSGLTTPTRGLYMARIEVKVPICPQLADGKKLRQGIIRVTPQGEDPRVFNITQEAPFLSFIKTTESVPRKSGIIYTTFVEVNTNIQQEDLEITRSNPVGSDAARITQGSSFYNVDATRPRLMRFDVNTDMTTKLGIDESSADFSVNTKVGAYGITTTPKVTVQIERADLMFNFFWRWASILGTNDYRFLQTEDETMTYIYPWQTTDVTFDLASNIKGAFDTSNTGNKLGKGTVTAGTPAPGDGYDATPYTFSFNNENYNTKGEYTLFFKGDASLNGGKEHSRDIFFRQGVQMWSRTALPNNGNVGAAGYTKGSTKIYITGNVLWDISIGSWTPAESASWIQLREGEASAWETPVTAAPMRVDSRVASPQEHAGEYPLESVLTKKTPFYVAVDPYNTLNATPESRSAEISFQNLSLHPTKGGAIIAQPTIKFTQFAPALEHVSNGLPESSVPGGGVTYNVVARTNMQGWGVKVYQGGENTGSPISDKAFGASPVISAFQAATGHQVAVPVGANSGNTDRTLSFWLYCSEFPGQANEFKFAEKSQTVPLNMAISTLKRDYNAGTVSQIVINDPGNAGWTLAVSSTGGWLQRSNVSGGGATTTDIAGFGNSTSYYVYATQNTDETRTGTVTLKTQSGAVVKTFEITQTERAPQIISLETGFLNAQGRGKKIVVQTYGTIPCKLTTTNGFGISDSQSTHNSRSSVTMNAAGTSTYYITRGVNYGNGDQNGTVAITFDGTTSGSSKTVTHHTCIQPRGNVRVTVINGKKGFQTIDMSAHTPNGTLSFTGTTSSDRQVTNTATEKVWLKTTNRYRISLFPQYLSIEYYLQVVIISINISYNLNVNCNLNEQPLLDIQRPNP